MTVSEEWIEMKKYEGNHCKVFAKPTSYLLMDPEEREQKWLDDVKHGRSPAYEWLETMREMKRKGAAQCKTPTSSSIISKQTSAPSTTSTTSTY